MGLISYKLFCFLTIALISTVTSTMSETIAFFNNPDVESTWRESGVYYPLVEGHDKGEVKFLGETIIASASVTQLTVVCSAHYPVYWDWDIASPISATSSRTSLNFTDPSSYIYTSHLRLATTHGRVVTGGYICLSPVDRNYNTTRFVFWKDASQNLIHGNPPDYTASSRVSFTTWSARPAKTITITADKFNRTITIPCSVSDPDTRPVLYKRNTTGAYTVLQIAPATKGIEFDAKSGFILSVPDLPDVYGVYKCSVGYGIVQETIIANVTSDSSDAAKDFDNKPAKNIQVGRAKYSFEKANNRISCCSNGTKPPRIYKNACETKHGCEKISQQLQSFQFFDRLGEASGNCRVASVADGPHFGVFRCFGDGIDVTRHYYVDSSLNGDTPNQSGIYYNDEAASFNKSQFIQVSAFSPLREFRLSRLYSTQTIVFKCLSSIYYFVSGMRWSIIYQNGTQHILPATKSETEGASSVSSDNYQQNSNTIRFYISKDMRGVVCHAPLFDSSGWVNKTMDLNVLDSTTPQVVGGMTENIKWLLGDSNKELSCEILGTPQPEITWTDPWAEHGFGGSTWRNISSNVKEIKVNNTSRLKFRTVMQGMEGSYSCEGTSLIGKARKVFSLTVAEPKPEDVIPTSSLRTTYPEIATTNTTESGNNPIVDIIKTPTKEPIDLSLLLAIVTAALVACVALLPALIFRIRKQQRIIKDSTQCVQLTWNASQSNCNYEDIGI